MTEATQGASTTDTPPGAAMDRRVERPRRAWWQRRVTWIAVAAVLAAVALWRWLPAAGSTDIAASAIETGEVTRGPFDDYLPVRATVTPRLTTLVGVLAGGQVEQLLVQDGAMVAAGQPLATLANPELRLDVLTREAAIASQLGSIAGEGLGIERSRLDRSAQVSQAEYDLIKARRDLTIRQQLFDKGIVTEAGVAGYRAEAEYQARRLAQLRAGAGTEARITATQGQRLADTQARLSGNLAAVRGGLSALTIRAPAAGRLTNFTLQPGQTLKPGDPAGQVDSEGSWKLTADVDEYYLGRVAVGQKARAEGATLTVSKVLPAVKEGRFRVELTFDTTPANLNRGQTLDIRITLGAASKAVVAPVGGWLAVDNGAFAFVVDADGTHATRRPVKLGRRNPEAVEILSGLNPGDRIVTTNLSSVKGDAINIR
ncbi:MULTISPECIES: HlyD family efflux transporter periplasmic adaptor subunit [unclassified Sphingomonas]|uniref:efflux RND transporter periplasmic adaptor subunit n=1 Tax=unclassified Sphingomonas TaxID=196159 RepID=UPI001F49D5A6|nr:MULTISPECIES: HlyD family efflux transporter periplasmic adaptor subunit [unclassified Sphingomonas]